MLKWTLAWVPQWALAWVPQWALAWAPQWALAWALVAWALLAWAPQEAATFAWCRRRKDSTSPWT